MCRERKQLTTERACIVKRALTLDHFGDSGEFRQSGTVEAGGAEACGAEVGDDPVACGSTRR